MNQNLYSYLQEKNITVETLALINVLLQFGGRIRSHFLADEYKEAIEAAEAEGYTTVVDNQICLTKKSEMFLRTFFQIAKEEGEL